MDPHSSAPEKNTSHGNEVLPQDTRHLIQRPCYQRGSPCQDPAGKWTTRRRLDHRKETQTAVVLSYLSFIRCGHSHLARHSERGRRQGRQRKWWEDNNGEWTSLEFGRSQSAVENRKMEKTGCKIICGAPTTLAVKGLMMMMMMMMMMNHFRASVLVLVRLID